MKLPEAIRKIVKTEQGVSPRNIDEYNIKTYHMKIFMEEYVLSYLKYLGSKHLESGEGKKAEKIILYGSKYREDETDIYIIYGAASACLLKEETSGNSYGDILFDGFEEIGCFNINMWSSEQDECAGILLGNKNGGQPAEEIFIFCEKNEKMEEYLKHCYEEGLTEKKNNYLKTKTTGEKEVYAELKAASTEDMGQPDFLFSIIRATVICIFIIFCAIAVMTVNSYGKLNKFVDAAVEVHQAVF